MPLSKMMLPVCGILASLIVPAAAAIPGFQAWSGVSFTGHTRKWAAPEIAYNVCYDITAEFPPFSSGSVLSVKADAGARYTCNMFDNTVCDPHSPTPNDMQRLGVGAGGSYYDLSNPEEGWGGRVHAFKCTLDA